MADIPKKDQPISEQYRVAAKEWVQLDGAARMLEDTKTAVLAEMIGKRGDVPHNRAEREVKASAEWREFIESMVDARTKANLTKVKLEWLRMRHNEWQSINANYRHEARLTG